MLLLIAGFLFFTEAVFQNETCALCFAFYPLCFDVFCLHIIASFPFYVDLRADHTVKIWKRASPAKPLFAYGAVRLAGVSLLLMCVGFFWRFLGAHKSYNNFNFPAEGSSVSLLVEAAN